MDTTILASLISAGAAIIVCMVNNHFTMKRTEKAQQDNNGNLVRTLVDE